jgi:S-DNA-T family DNA segregation ATPase FtsK/SpoIIIE
MVATAPRRASRRRPAARGRRPRPRRRSARRSARTGTLARLRSAVTAQLGGHAGDITAVALTAAGVLALLGIATDAAGPLGRGVDRVGHDLFGSGALLVPLVCFAGAALLLLARSRGAAAGIRIGVGLTLVLAGVAGMLHLADGAPATWSATHLRGAGGLAGGAVGRPVVAATGTAGAWVVFGAALVLGILLTTGTRLADAGRVLAAGGRGLGRAAGATGRRLGAFLGAQATADPEPEADAEPEPRPALEPTAAPEPEIEIEIEPEPAADPEPEPRFAGFSEAPVEAVAPAAATAASAAAAEAAAPSEWRLPEPELLKRSTQQEVDRRTVDQGGEVLEQTMREFGVDARLVGATVGPTVTRYELELAAGVKVNKVTGLAHDIAYAMASPDVRILAPIPGRSAIGIEVPNRQRQLVTLGDILSSAEAAKSTHPLEVGLGRDISGRAVMLNLATMPHLLIAGSTGAGKSSCINSIVTSILMRSTPDEVRLILVDPKRVELGAYSGLPHLLTDVVTNPKRAANALDWAVKEMEMRYDLLAEVGVRDISGYNSMYDRAELPTEDDPDPDTGRSYRRLPYILVVVDELNDLMMVAARDVETSICRIAQMARAVGIHLVIATQRPSVDVITGVIKANIPSRLAFSVSSLQDSRVILDQAGAEKLIGQGDMLVLSASSNRPQRVQGSWVDETCIRKVVAHWRRQAAKPDYVEALAEELTLDSAMAGDPDDSDDLLAEAMELVVRSGLGSTSMLQRKLRVGFARAGRIMDLLERRGVVGPSEGSKARAVLMTVEELEEMRARA